MDQSYGFDPPCGLESLPLDLKVDVLKAMRDVPSLISLTHASSSFYRISQLFQVQILAAVLSNEIPAALMDDVSFTFESSELPDQSVDCVLEFLDIYHPHWEITADQILPPKLAAFTLEDALRISKLHSNVRFFTNDFCSSILSAHPISRSPEPAFKQPSNTELTRIMRAFYWFQLYCNLYQKCGYSDDEFRDYEWNRQDEYDAINDKVVELLFNKYYPWEIEQLCCVLEYLSRRLDPAFEEMVEYNVSWYNVNPYDSEDYPNMYKEDYLSRGLDFVRQVIQVETFEARKMVFDSCRFSDSQLSGLALALEITGNGTSEVGFDPAFPPLSDEGIGPYRAWCWAYSSLDSVGNIKQYRSEFDKKDFWEWGYCLWDLRRLQDWLIFKHPWTPERANQRQVQWNRTKVEWDAKLQVSRTIRKQIHHRGGSGWWAPGDWSRIVWTRDTKPEGISPEEVDGEPEWIVDEVLASRIVDGTLQYQLRWQGWDEDLEWYNATLLKKAPIKVQAFHEQYPNQPGPPRRLQEWLIAAVEDRLLEDYEEDNLPVRGMGIGLAESGDQDTIVCKMD